MDNISPEVVKIIQLLETSRELGLELLYAQINTLNIDSYEFYLLWNELNSIEQMFLAFHTDKEVLKTHLFDQSKFVLIIQSIYNNNNKNYLHTVKTAKQLMHLSLKEAKHWCDRNIKRD